MTEPTKEQIMSALNDYNENYTKVFDELPESLKDEVHGVNYSRGMDSNEIIGFMIGYIAAKKSDFEEIKTLKEQLAEAIEQRQKAEDVVGFYSDLKNWQLRGDGRTCIISRDREVVMSSNFGGKLARQYFVEKEKQDKENKE